MHLCVCALQCVLDTNCKEFTVVASWMHQISSNFENRLIFLSDGMRASVWKARWWCGDGRCDVASSQSFSSIMGILPSECFGKIPLSPSSQPLRPHSCAEPPGCLVPGYWHLAQPLGTSGRWVPASPVPATTIEALQALHHRNELDQLSPTAMDCSVFQWACDGDKRQFRNRLLLLISASALWQECCKAAVEPSFHSILFGELTSPVCKVVVFGLWYVVFAFVCLFLCGFSFLFPLRLCSCCTAQSSFSSGLCYMNLGLVVGAVLFLSVPRNYSAQHCVASHCGQMERHVIDLSEALLQPANQTSDPTAHTQGGKRY